MKANRFFKKKANPRLMIFGLDGVPIELLRKYCDSGIMPRLKKILESGKTVPMQASLPDISSVSWSGFMTGSNSGSHGIYGFVDLVPGTYDYYFPNFRHLKQPTFFDRLGKLGKRSIIINLPATYPARPVCGVLVSGFVAPTLSRAVFPLRYLDLARQLGYIVDVDASQAGRQPGLFFSELNYSLQVRQEMAQKILERENWAVFMFTVTGTDRLHHFFFDAWDDPQNQWHQEFVNYYRKLDQVLGDLFDLCSYRGTEWMMLSDHGFTKSRQEVYLNQLLKDRGFFSNLQASPGPDFAPVADSLAFSLDPNRIYINLEGKYPGGKVKKSDYSSMRQDIKTQLQEYRIDGKRVFEKVFEKEEVFSGPFIGQAPDLLPCSFPGFDIKAGFTAESAVSLSRFKGMHRWDNAFFACSKPQLIRDNLQIFDVSEIIFNVLGGGVS